MFFCIFLVRGFTKDLLREIPAVGGYQRARFPEERASSGANAREQWQRDMRSSSQQTRSGNWDSDGAANDTCPVSVDSVAL